jgi:tRNA modification GTPase
VRSDDDTIAAVATPSGRGALALVRLSGPRAWDIAAAVLEPWPLTPRRATLVTVRDPDTGMVLDRPIATAYEAPHSFTGGRAVEITTHGGAIVPAAVLAALVAAGARPALPGEFTRRAVLAGKLDLAQAEALGDLIDARSAAAHRAALSQLDGGLSRRIAALRSALLDTEALIAYDIDFPEEDDGPIPRERVATSAFGVAVSIDRLLATAPVGELLRDGALVVIAGPPNAGKSSLFNALLGRARALVTEVPGTTRDAIEALVEPTGAAFPLRLVDTAGLRETTDTVERLGIEVSERYLHDAHAVLACGETAEALTDTVARVHALTAAPVVPVRTKADLRTGNGAAAIAASAETGQGLREVLDAVYRAVPVAPADPDAPIVTRARHRASLLAAAGEIQQFQDAWASKGVPTVVAAVHLRAAVHALEEIIGVVDTEDILDRVFAEFCVGK